MLGWFKRAVSCAVPDTSALGGVALALRMPGGASVPAECIGVALGHSGATQRFAAGTRLPSTGDAFCFHPGPYTIELVPFIAAPEMGLYLSFLIDAPDLRVAQQRFDLYLVSEADAMVTVDQLRASIEETVQRELAQGVLELPPCTSNDEWREFRGHFNRLLYQRYGITVDDCIPIDLGDKIDYVHMLRERAKAPAMAPAQSAPSRDVAAIAPAAADALALRRLFLELPALASGLRQVTLPEGQGHFQRLQCLLQRLDHVALSVDTMPALGLAGPDRTLDMAGQATRARACQSAGVALDEAWSVLARLTGSPAALLDEGERIVANLEMHCANRRAAL